MQLAWFEYEEGLLYKVLLYVDELLLYRSYLDSSMPVALKMVSDCGRVLRYKVILAKILFFSLIKELSNCQSSPCHSQ